jgi:hypothetical protein
MGAVREGNSENSKYRVPAARFNSNEWIEHEMWLAPNLRFDPLDSRYDRTLFQRLTPGRRLGALSKLWRLRKRTLLRQLRCPDGRRALRILRHDSHARGEVLPSLRYRRRRDGRAPP